MKISEKTWKLIHRWVVFSTIFTNKLGILWKLLKSHKNFWSFMKIPENFTRNLEILWTFLKHHENIWKFNCLNRFWSGNCENVWQFMILTYSDPELMEMCDSSMVFPYFWSRDHENVLQFFCFNTFQHPWFLIPRPTWAQPGPNLGPTWTQPGTVYCFSTFWFRNHEHV